MNINLDEKKPFKFFFNHNLNEQIKNQNYNFNHIPTQKNQGLFFNKPNNNTINANRKDIRGYNNNNNNKLKTDLNLNSLNIKLEKSNDCISIKGFQRHFNSLANSHSIKLNKENILEQINQMIEIKKNNKKNNNNNNNDINNMKPKKNIGNPCFKNIQITSIQNKIIPNKTNNNLYENSNTHEFVQKAISVKSFSYNEDVNKKNRKEMQDFHKIKDKYLNSDFKGYFSILDGHGGSEPIKYATNRLPEIFGNFLFSSHFNIEKSFINSFQKIDEELKNYDEIDNCGSTCTIIYIDTELNSIFCANVGDSKSVLMKYDKSFKVLTKDHKIVTNNEEVLRIKEKGGLVFNNRLFGQLALTRALGDLSMKENGLINTPYVSKNSINEDDALVVVASDGVWDVYDEKEITEVCLDMLKDGKNVDEIGKFVVKSCLDKGSCDNISCIIIQIN